MGCMSGNTMYFEKKIGNTAISSNAYLEDMSYVLHQNHIAKNQFLF